MKYWLAGLQMCALMTRIFAQNALTDLTVGEYSQRYSDFVMDQRLCIGASIGFEFLANVMSTIQDRYIKFYNNPRRYKAKALKHRRGKAVENG